MRSNALLKSNMTTRTYISVASYHLCVISTRASVVGVPAIPQNCLLSMASQTISSTYFIIIDSKTFAAIGVRYIGLMSVLTDISGFVFGNGIMLIAVDNTSKHERENGISCRPNICPKYNITHALLLLLEGFSASTGLCVNVSSGVMYVRITRENHIIQIDPPDGNVKLSTKWKPTESAEYVDDMRVS